MAGSGEDFEESAAEEVGAYCMHFLFVSFPPPHYPRHSKLQLTPVPALHSNV